MALNASGPMSIGGPTTGQSLNLEMGRASTATTSLGESASRVVAEVPSGTIALSNFYGKSDRITVNLTIPANTLNYTLNTAKIVSGYRTGKTDVILTINSGVYVGSSSTATAALTVDTSWAAGDTVKVVNNGVILGAGGAGGYSGAAGYGPSAGAAGGKSLSILRTTTITNNGTISGGGGGGGGGGSFDWVDPENGPFFYSGGGGGGGLGYSGGGGGNTGGYSFSMDTYYPTAGGSGNSAGYGSGGQGGVSNGYEAGNGGNGGTYGAAGAYGADCPNPYYGPSGTLYTGAAGGAGGPCITGNSYVTWLTTGTRYGSIS